MELWIIQQLLGDLCLILSTSNHSDLRRPWNLPLKSKLHFFLLWVCSDAISHGDCWNSSCCGSWLSLGAWTYDRIDAKWYIINRCCNFDALNDSKWLRQTKRDSLSYHHSRNFWRHSCPCTLWNTIHNSNQLNINIKDFDWNEHFVKFLLTSFWSWNRSFSRRMRLVILNFK